MLDMELRADINSIPFLNYMTEQEQGTESQQSRRPLSFSAIDDTETPINSGFESSMPFKGV